MSSLSPHSKQPTDGIDVNGEVFEQRCQRYAELPLIIRMSTAGKTFLYTSEVIRIAVITEKVRRFRVRERISGEADDIYIQTYLI